MSPELQIAEKLRQLSADFVNLKTQFNEKKAELIQSNKLLQAEIVKSKTMAAEILEITQAEQKRFGSQLHDGLCQELAAILIFAKGLAQKMEKNTTLDLAELQKISDMLLNAVDQARDTARGLYPGELEGSSLMHSLEDLSSLTLGVSCKFRCPEPILIEDNNIATHLYRIAQEGISNAVKHGKAKNIELSFTRNGDHVTLAIKDDGIGIVNSPKGTKGIGLKIMKYRAHIINATFQVKTNSPRGVLLECTLKMPKTKRKSL